ncbi:MAG: hypothetical protein H0W46_10105, partial [Acidimicrobiia bacterium]|nr:hypothetical protein [Acidimicrobiia bacterium]
MPPGGVARQRAAGVVALALGNGAERPEAGLVAYLAGPVGQGLREEVGHVPAQTTFVFGHTHKPFVSTRAASGFVRPVAVVNTGGWVVDHPDPEPLKGATIVLVDEELASSPWRCTASAPTAQSIRPPSTPS